MADNIDKWRGLKALVQDAVEQGTSAIERVHLGTAKRPFGILKSIQPLEKSVEDIEAIHDTIVAGTYGSVRAVSRVAGKVLDAALDALEDKADQSGSAGEPTAEDGTKPHE